MGQNDMIIGGEDALRQKWMDRKKPAIWPEFFVKAVEDPSASAEAGRVVFRDEEWCNMHHKGEVPRIIPESVKRLKQDRNIWPYIAVAYEAWRAGKEEVADGIDLKTWPLITPAQLRNCQNMNLRSVEDLATLPDGGVSKIGPGGRDLQRKAIRWLEGANDAGKAAIAAANLQRQNEEMAADLENIKAQLAALKAEKSGGNRSKSG